MTVKRLNYEIGHRRHAPVGGLVPGVQSTGVKLPKVPYVGDGFLASELYARLAVRQWGQNFILQIRRNGVSMGTLTIDPGDLRSTWDGSVVLSPAVWVSNGDYFDVNVTQVGNDGPNQGSDLVWMVVS